MGEHEHKHGFSKTAKGLMRLMLGTAAMVASVGGLIASMGYFNWVRRAYMA